MKTSIFLTLSIDFVITVISRTLSRFVLEPSASFNVINMKLPINNCNLYFQTTLYM